LTETALPTAARTTPSSRLAVFAFPGLFAGLLIASLSIFYLSGLSSVPFHPDEATYLFMSADFERMLTDPASLSWDPARSGDSRQNYRLLDAPLTRLMPGLGRSLAGLPPLPADWNWSLSWDQNARNGALPGPGLLLAARLTLAALFPLSLGCLYWAVRPLSGRAGALLAVFLLGTHAIVLLHTRRVMGEAGMLLGITAFLAALPLGHRRPWLVGLTLALAFNAKHSSLALLPAGLAAVAWLPAQAPGNTRRALLNAGRLLAVFGLVTLALNPVLWKHPVEAGRTALAARQALLERQAADVQRLSPAQLLETPGERSLALLAHLYLAPPMFSETGNYLAETVQDEDAYLASPLNVLWRGKLWAAFMLAATLLGLAWAVQTAWRDPSRRRPILLVLMACGFQAAALVATVPLPWQRYSLPLVPFACILAASGIVWVLSWFLQNK
jgi:4-amino-4-deoxy-L-arabinose transferase-like glycosyltransferase